MTLTEFLLARVDEDEAVAREAIRGFRSAEWTDDGSIYAGHPVDEVVDWVYNDAQAHIARHDPARVLAECEAKRRIVELHPVGISERGWDEPSTTHCTTCSECCSTDWSVDTYPCATLRALALPYVGHPDYVQEWQP